MVTARYGPRASPTSSTGMPAFSRPGLQQPVVLSITRDAALLSSRRCVGRPGVQHQRRTLLTALAFDLFNKRTRDVMVLQMLVHHAAMQPAVCWPDGTRHQPGDRSAENAGRNHPVFRRGRQPGTAARVGRRGFCGNRASPAILRRISPEIAPLPVQPSTNTMFCAPWV